MLPDTFYKTPAGYAAMMAWYDQAVARLPALETGVVATRYGPTQVLAAGPAGAPVVVLLHGLGVNALVWARQLPALAAAGYRVYAPDIIGMAGRSAALRLPYDSRGYADWLGQTLDGLGVPAASLVGLDFGAWLIVRLAALAPERIQRAALLSPAGLLSVRWKYLVPILWDVLFINDEQAQRLARKLLAPPEAALDEDAVHLLYLSIKHLQQPFAPPGLPPAQIGLLCAPTLVLAGEHDDVWNPRELLSLARAALPDVRAELVAGAGHGLTASHADWVAGRLLQFLRDTAHPGR